MNSIEIDRTPLTENEVWEPPPFVFKGHSWTFLGEDGEMAIMRAHPDRQLLVDAMAAETGYEEMTVDDIEYRWAVFTRHVPDCREGLDDDEKCQCENQWEWWGDVSDKVTATTPGSVPVLYWSA